MICPKCNNEMKEGYIPFTERHLKWIPKEQSPSLFMGSLPEGAVMLKKVKFMGLSQQEASFCRRCNLVIIDTKDCQKSEY